MSTEQERKRGRLIPVTQWNDYHEWPPIGGLRHLIFQEQFNGFNKVVRRVGRRVLIDEDAFYEWVNEQSGPSSPEAGGSPNDK